MRRVFPALELLPILVVTSAAAAEPRPQSVRFVYLVSCDRPLRDDFRHAIEMAAKDIRGWYGRQLGGPTFRLNDPIVEVARSDKPARWFYSHPNGDNKENWGFNNGLAEAHRLLGAKLGDPRYVWVIYSDGPGNKGRGGNGVTVLPEDDLLGLIGKHPEQKDVKRWIAGLGHELGHAFGLPHPRDTTKDADAIMWMGIYGKYPDKTYLTREDKRSLGLSPFFFRPDGQPVQSLAGAAERYDYAGGSFARFVTGGTSVWVESKTDGPERYQFEETGRDANWIRLRDPGRGMDLRLPVGGGTCAWSTDDGKTWNPLYRVERAK